MRGARRERDRRLVVGELALGDARAGLEGMAEGGDLVGQGDVDGVPAAGGDLGAQRALAGAIVADRVVLGDSRDEGVERPSDIDRLLYVDVDRDDWQQRLAREMKDAGLPST